MIEWFFAWDSERRFLFILPCGVQEEPETKRAKTEPEVMVVDLRAKLEAKQKAKTDPNESGPSQSETTRVTRSRGRKVGVETSLGLASHQPFQQVGFFSSVILGSLHILYIFLPSGGGGVVGAWDGLKYWQPALKQPVLKFLSLFQSSIN